MGCSCSKQRIGTTVLHEAARHDREDTWDIVRHSKRLDGLRKPVNRREEGVLSKKERVIAAPSSEKPAAQSFREFSSSQAPDTALNMLCCHCQAFIIEYYTQSRPSPNSFSFKHGSLTELKDSARAGCLTCGLVSQALGTNGEYEPWISGSSEQSILYWSNLRLELYNPGKFGCQDNQAPLVDEIVEGVQDAYYYQPWERESAYDLQRNVPPKTDDLACFELVEIWMNCCTRLHHRCRRQSTPNLPTRIIDVGEESTNPLLLESPGKTGSYITLSHRWGGTLSFKTTTANINEHKKRISVTGMPTTFRDAIVVCRRLGIRYLWIDALCIIQDSPEDWGREAANMASIYANSLFTISALHADSSDGGLFCERPTRPCVIFKSPVAGKDKPTVMGMRQASPSFDQEMRSSPLVPRGWVYQERVLSTATLHYGANQMFWECRSKLVSESSGRIEVFTEAVTYDFARGLAVDQTDRGYFYEHWADIVQVFSRTQFTVKTDKLAAIMGVAQRFKEPSFSTFISGMWLENLHKELLWAFDPRESPSLFGPPSNPASQPVLEPNWEPRHPTWSWISVDYPVHTIVGVGADELDWDCQILDVDEAHLPDLAAYRKNETKLGLKIKGNLLELGQGEPVYNRQIRPVTLSMNIGQRRFEISGQIDAGCRVEGTMYALRIATARGMGVTPIPPRSYFLFLEQLSGSQGHFKRVGIGSGSPDVLRMLFQFGSRIELTLI